MEKILTLHYEAEVSAYKDTIIRILIPDGQKHAPSGAVLPCSPCNFRVNISKDAISISTGQLSVTIEPLSGAILIHDKSGRLLTRTSPGNAYKRNNEHGFSLNFQLSEDEHIYGLGEDNDIAYGQLDRRGTVRDMLTGQRINQNHVTADFPIPFWLGSNGETHYGIFLDNTSNLTIDIGKTTEDTLAITAPAGACVFYIKGRSNTSDDQTDIQHP